MASRNYSTAAIVILALVTMRCDYGNSLMVTRNQRTFLPRPSNHRSYARTSRTTRQQLSSSPMKMYIDEILPMATMDIPSLSQISESLASASITPSSPTATSLVETAPTNIFTTRTQLITSDPQVEAELLNDVSHVVLDFTTFFSPNTVWLRLYNVIGHIFVIGSDYISDKYIAPDEVFFQALMLAVSTHLFLRSAWPLMLAASSVTSLTVRDRRAYTELFDAVGLSILQFKTLLVSRTLDWVEVPQNGEVQLDGSFMYWLYSGDVSATDDGINNISQDDSHIGNRIFGEVQFAKSLEASMYKNKKGEKSARQAKKAAALGEENASFDATTKNEQGSIKAGFNGATLLRISTSKLLELMDNDAQLSGSIHRLVLLCMQKKLTRTLSSSASLKTDSTSNATAGVTTR